MELLIHLLDSLYYLIKVIVLQKKSPPSCCSLTSDQHRRLNVQPSLRAWKSASKTRTVQQSKYLPWDQFIKLLSCLVFRKKDLYLVITQKLTKLYMKSTALFMKSVVLFIKSIVLFVKSSAFHEKHLKSEKQHWKSNKNSWFNTDLSFRPGVS